MVDQRRNKFELDTFSGSDTWPRIKRSSKPSGSSQINEGSLEYFEQMRQELIPHLNAQVKEKATMYDKIQRQAQQDEIYSKGKDRRSRSRTNSLSGRHGFPEKARRAHSAGALQAAVNDEKIKTNKVESYHPSSSITRRTPIKAAQTVVQKKTIVDHGKRSAANTPGVKHCSEHSFQYDNRPALVNEGRKITSSAARASKNKSGEKDERVSVNALIQQWSGPEGKDKKQAKTSDSTNRNRCSLPANFMNNNISENDEPQVRRVKSVSAHMYDKTQNDCPEKALQSEINASRRSEHATDTRNKSKERLVKIDATAESRQETKKEGSSWNERNSWDKKEIASKNEKWMSEETKPYPPNQLSSEKGRERLREIQNEDHRLKESATDRKRSLPNMREFSNETQFESTGTHKDSEVGQNKISSKEKRRSEPMAQYATMSTRQSKTPCQSQSNEKNETSKTEREFVDKKDCSTAVNSKDTRRYENNVDVSHKSNNQLQKKKSSFRHLPTYEEAIEPLHETDVREETERAGGNQEKLRMEHWSTTTVLHHFSSPEETSNGKTKELRNRERKQPIQENVVKQRVSDTKTVPELDSLFSADNLPEREATKKPETINHNQDEGFPSPSKTIGHCNSAASKNESINKSSPSVIKSSNLVTQDSHSKSESDGVKEIASNQDLNNNVSTVYDEQLQKTMPQNRRRKSDSNTAEKDIVHGETKIRNDDFSSQESRAMKGNQVQPLKEQERLRQQQKIILDEDFKQRGSSRVTPDVVQQLTRQDGMGFSNVVHDNELVELVAAEEKYWKEKAEKKDQVSEDKKKPKLEKTDEKHKRVDEMLREFKLHDQNNSTRVDNSELTDTLRAEEEFLAQEAEKLLKLRFQEKSANSTKKKTNSSSLTGPLVGKTKETYDSVNIALDSPESPVTTVPSIPPKSPSTSSDDVKLEPEADQAYHNQPRRISHSKTPVYMCSGCRLPVQRDICLFVSELQSYWHEKCFRCSVCQSNLIRGRSTPKIRVMFSKIHCENCLSNKKTGGQSTMV